MAEKPQFADYVTEQFYDELFESDGVPRPEANLLVDTVNSLEPGELIRRPVSR